MSELTWKQMHEAAVEFQADLQDKLSASQAREKELREKLADREAAFEARTIDFNSAYNANIAYAEQVRELKRENAELRKLLEESKVPDWKSIIIDRLHSKVGVCMTCGQHKCPHVSNTTLPDTVQIDDVLWCINLDEYFFKEEIQPKEPKQ